MALNALMSPEATKQAVRLQRYFIAAGSSLMVIGLLFVCFLRGYLDQPAFITLTIMILFLMGAFYLIFRLRINYRFADPSLTLAQMATSSFTILYGMYAANGARSVFVIILVMIFLFGVLRFGRRALLLFTLSILSGYLAVIVLLGRFKPETMDMRLEITQWIVVALTLPWFALMGGYVSELRMRLRRTMENCEAHWTQLKRANGIWRSRSASLA